MSEAYEEIVLGETMLRLPPGVRHETICGRLHDGVASSVTRSVALQLLPPRTVVALAPGTLVRPDLALVTAAGQRAWLIAEVVDSSDHTADTVTKKICYEELRLPRLWMVDPRYDNVEVYHGTPHGLALRQVLDGNAFLEEGELAGFQIGIRELFAL